MYKKQISKSAFRKTSVKWANILFFIPANAAFSQTQSLNNASRLMHSPLPVCENMMPSTTKTEVHYGIAYCRQKKIETVSDIRRHRAKGQTDTLIAIPRTR